MRDADARPTPLNTRERDSNDQYGAAWILTLKVTFLSYDPSSDPYDHPRAPTEPLIRCRFDAR